MDLSGDYNQKLKVVLFVHFVFATWGIQGYWSPNSYLFYNVMFFLTLLWSIHVKDNSPDPLQITLVINAVSIFFDIIVLGTYFPVSVASSERFSAGMAILNLVARPVTTLLMYRVFTSRFNVSDNFNNLFGASSPTTSAGRYEDIDNSVRS